MMYKSKSSALAKLKPLLLAPILTFLMLVFACNKTPEVRETDTSPEILPDEKVTITEPVGEETSSQEDSITADQVFYIVEDMPLFNGGDAGIEFRKYIAQNLRYPESAAAAGIQGRVIVQFAVNTQGKVVDAVVVRSVDPELDKEALRVVNSSPAWTPGKQRGKPVSVLFTFPINFVQQ